MIWNMKFRIAIVLLAIAVSPLLFDSPSYAGKKIPTKDVIINVVGDVHGESAIKRDAIPSLKKYFDDGNLNIFNLETAVTNQSVKEEKQYNFKTNLAFLQTLKSIGLNVATSGFASAVAAREGGGRRPGTAARGGAPQAWAVCRTK